MSSSSGRSALHLPSNRCTTLACIALFAVTLLMSALIPSAAHAWPERFGAPFKTLDGYGLVNGVTLADLNGDGHLDVAVASGSPADVGIRFGNGSAAEDFKLREDYTTGFTTPTGVRSADMQGDGIPDLIVTDTGTNQVKVILRAGPGSPAILAQTTGSGPNRLATGDLNHDGRQDVVTANRLSNTVSVFLGNGDGTLAPKVDYATGDTPRDVTLADVNGDGNLDILTPNFGTNDVTIWFGTGTGTFSSHVTLPDGSLGPFSIVVTRLNGDSLADIVVSNCAPCFGGPGSNLSVFLGTGGGSFAAPTIIPSVASPTLLAADFSGDGKMDIAALNDGLAETVGSTYVRVGDGIVHLGNGAGGFTGVMRFKGGGIPLDAAAGDLNHDGFTDIALASWQHDASILLGHGDGSFGSGDVEVPTGDNQSGKIVAADMNGDNHLDVVVSRPGSFEVLTGNGFGLFTSLYSTSVSGTGRSSIAVADVDNDGDRDIAVARKESATIALYKNLGGSSGFSLAQTFGAIVPTAIVAGDFNNDGAIDFATSDSTNTGWVSIFTNGAGPGGPGSFGLTGSVDLGAEPLSAIAVGQLNADANADLVAAGPSGVYVLLGNGAGGFGITSYPTAPNPRALTLADFDSDGRLDIAVACNGAVSILRNLGGGAFAPAINYTIAGDHLGIAAGETNLDGWVDLVVTNKDEGTATVLLGEGDGTFVVSRDQSWGVGRGASGIAVATEPGDNLPDMFVAKEGAFQWVQNAIPFDNETWPTVRAPNIAFVEAGGNLTFDVNAIDPDGEPMVSLTCTSSPTGSTFTTNGDNTVGTFSWSPTSSQVGTYTATFQAYNPGTGQATTTIQVRPAGTSLTGTMLWTPDSGTQGPYSVCFAASNGQGGNATTCTTITVNPPGQAAPMPRGAARDAGTTAMSNPVITVPATTTAITGQQFALGVSVSNASWLTVNTSGLPASNNATFRVNQSPIVSAPTQVSALPNAPLTVNVTAVSPDGSPITALTADLSAFPQANLPSFTPNGNNTGGTLSWTPTATENGNSYGVTFLAKNALVGVAGTVIQVTDRPTAYYRLNGDLNEVSGGAPLQPLFGTAAYSTGKLGLGSDFDGIASHAIGVTPSGTAFDFGAGFTAECWVKVRSVPTAGNVLMIARYGTQIFNLWPNWSFNVEGSTGGVLGRALFAFETSLHTLYLESSSRIDDGAFHHLAVTYDGITINFYVDGVLQSAGTASGYSLSTAGGLFEVGGGARNGTTTSYLNGVVDEIRIWHVARTQAQIVASKDMELFTPITAVETSSPVYRDALAQNRPNPFNPDTEIEFELKAASLATLRIYDSSGRLVRTLVDAALSSGPHRARWDGMTDEHFRAASGVYFYRLEGAGITLGKRMVLMR